MALRRRAGRKDNSVSPYILDLWKIFFIKKISFKNQNLEPGLQFQANVTSSVEKSYLFVQKMQHPAPPPPIFSSHVATASHCLLHYTRTTSWKVPNYFTPIHCLPPCFFRSKCKIDWIHVRWQTGVSEYDTIMKRNDLSGMSGAPYPIKQCCPETELLCTQTKHTFSSAYGTRTCTTK